MIFVLFPGQGSQKPGMGKDYYDASGPARETLDEAEAIVGAGFLEQLFDGPEDALRDTRSAQPALVAMGVAIARHLTSAGVEPEGVAGHSIGEIAALVVAGSLTFADAMRLTVERARLMAEETAEGSMAAVLGLDARAIEANLPEGAEVANYNGPGQTIISGGEEALDAAADALKEAGAKRVLPLKVSGPFHSSYMKPAALLLRDYLEDVAIADPKLRFVSSVTGAHETDANTIRELLWKQLYSPVRWTEVMETVGEVKAVEAGPGNVLQGLAKRMDGAPDVSLAGKLEDIEKLALI